MKSTSSALPPAHLLWFTTLASGTVLVAFTLLLNGLEHLFNNINDVILVTLWVGSFAIVFSLPTLIILPFGIRWVLDTAVTSSRWARLLLVISALSGLAVSFGYCFLISSGIGMRKGPALFMSSYLIAALFAAVIIYRRWLFRP
jgi:hypothetical protein